MNKFALINGRIVTHKEVFCGAIFVESGKIVDVVRGVISPNSESAGLFSDASNRMIGRTYNKIRSPNTKYQIIDLNGKHILPGLIDAHVHFRTPGMTKEEDWLTGSKAALAGGVTTVLDMPNTLPPTIDALSLDKKRALVRKKALVNYGFYIGATTQNLQKVKKLKNIAGVKIYMAGSTGNLLLANKKDLERFVAESKQLLAVHAESEDCILEHLKKYKNGSVGGSAPHSIIRPPECAFEAVKMLLHLAKKYQARVHICHVSTQKELEVINKFKNKMISVEVTPHHLFLTEADYKKHSDLLKVNPPLRGFADQVVLWDGIKTGLIDMVATDHAPHLLAERCLSYKKAPAGVPGIQTMLPLLLNAVNEGKLTLQRVVRLSSYNPARSFGISGKGIIERGFDADLTVVDMDLTAKVDVCYLWSKCGWSPFEGWKLKGWPVMTFVGGNLLYEWRGRFGRQPGKEVRF